ncbi:MAG: ParA family protein [Myxococcota bacterium]
MTRRIAFINEKGGVGKTTLAVNVAAWFALKKQRRVLLVDLDTQGHAGKSLGVDARAASPNVFHLLTDGAVPFDAVVRPTSVPGLDVVPSWKEMADFPTVAASDPERVLRLRRALEPALGRYDAVVLDAPPSLGLTTTNVLLAAEEIVIPVATTYLALDGCAEMNDTVARVAAEHQHAALRVTQVVPTLYRKTQLADEVVAMLKKYFPKRVSEPMTLNVAIDEAQSHGKTIWEYAPWSRGATILQAVAEAIDRAGC